MFCGHHIVALHSFFFIKSTLVVRWCVHVSIIRTHLACKMPCERPVFQIAENPKEISWVGQHISRLSRMLLAGCSVDFTCGVADVFLGEFNTSSALMSQRLKKVQNANIFCHIHSPMQLISSIYAYIHAYSSLTATCSCSLSVQAASSSVRSSGALLKMKSSVFSHLCSQSATWGSFSFLVPVPLITICNKRKWENIFTLYSQSATHIHCKISSKWAKKRNVHKL